MADNLQSTDSFTGQDLFMSFEDITREYRALESDMEQQDHLQSKQTTASVASAFSSFQEIEQEFHALENEMEFCDNMGMAEGLLHSCGDQLQTKQSAASGTIAVSSFHDIVRDYRALENEMGSCDNTGLTEGLLHSCGDQLQTKQEHKSILWSNADIEQDCCECVQEMNTQDNVQTSFEQMQAEFKAVSEEMKSKNPNVSMNADHRRANTLKPNSHNTVWMTTQMTPPATASMTTPR